MPHVAVLFEFPTLNGGEQSMLAVLKRLRDSHNFRFTAIAPPDGSLADRLRQLQIPHVPLGFRGSDEIRRPAAEIQAELQAILLQLQPHILHANSLSMARMTGQLQLTELPRCRRTGHLRDIIRLKQKVIADLNQNDALVAVSEATRSFHVAQGLDAERCRVIYNGVDTTLFRPRSGQRTLVLPQLPVDATVLLSVGQICLRKGQLILAEAAAQLPATDDRIHLVIAGQRHSTKRESAEFEQAVRQQFVGRGLSDRLHMIGYRSDIPQLMNASDILVHAAHQEPFGRTLLEAAASGLPIIATDVGGTSEMLRRDKDALLVKAGDVTALQTAIERLTTTPVLAEQLSRSARHRVQTCFPIQTAATALADFWRDQADGFSVGAE
ncbi:MAG: glycosyltransferase family 4 protein [Fuerstiella sp.]